MMSFSPISRSQRGAALVVGLIILAVVTLLSVVGVRMGTQELRMANNAEDMQTAFQQAQAAIDYLAATPDLLPVIGGVGFTICSTNYPTVCDQKTIAFPSPFNNSNTMQLTRVNPGTGLPPRILATSASLFAAAYYAGQSQYDTADAGRGRSRLGVGLMRLMPKS
jgi:type II secretory pathway pseudopilin PulG